MITITITGHAPIHNDIKNWCFKNFGAIHPFGGNWNWGNVEYMYDGPNKGEIKTRYNFERDEDATFFTLRWL